MPWAWWEWALAVLLVCSVTMTVLFVAACRAGTEEDKRLEQLYRELRRR